MKTTTTLSGTWTVGLLALLVSAPAGAVPLLLNHEGLLLEDDDLPMEGQVTLRFTLYDAAESGAALWSEEHEFELVGGYYRTTFGEQTSLEGVFADDPSWLAISVDGSPELEPRQRMSSVPYAFVATNAVGDITPRTITVAGELVVDEDGNWVGPARSVLESVRSVDGSGSGLDADRLDGVDSSELLVLSSDDAPGRVLALLRSADGSGSGLDADRLDGLDSAQLMRADEDTGTLGDLEVGGTLTVSGDVLLDGTVRLGTSDAECGEAAEAVLRWNGESKQPEVCNGAEWVGLTGDGGGGGGDGGGGGGDLPQGNGTTQEQAGGTCNTIRAIGAGRGNGVYWTDPDGGSVDNAVETWCDMETAGGGWTLLVNLASRDDAIHDYDDVGFWLNENTVGEAGAALTDDYKSSHYYRFGDTSEVMVLAHDQGRPLGWASYFLKPEYAGQSLQWMMGNLNHAVITSSRWRHSGSVGARHNGDRSQTLYGDLFLDHPHAMMVNRQSGWGSNVNRVRVSTTLDNAEYVHTFAGLGGTHRHGGWSTAFESAPISAYCALRNGYGDEAHHTAGNLRSISGQSFPASQGCRSGSFSWLPVDMALLVRERLSDGEPEPTGRTPAEAATSCKRVLDAGHSIGSGAYWLTSDPDNPQAAYLSWCEMSSYGGGWTMLFNLATRDEASHVYGDADFWLQAGESGALGEVLSAGFKSRAYSTLSGQTEVLVMLHERGVKVATATYDVLPSFRSRTFLWLVSNLTDAVITGDRTRRFGASGAVHNPERAQPLWGDLFTDNSHPLVINKQSGWGADTNQMRLGTTAHNTAHPHTFAGLGGHHGHEGWNVDFEAAPVSSYCALRNGYGDEALYRSGNVRVTGGSFPFDGGCRSGSFRWLPLDVAVFVRRTEEAGDDPDGSSPTRPGASCKALDDGGFNRGDGLYWIDPDGDGGHAPFQVWCLMSMDGGGWTMLLNLASRDVAIHGWRDTTFWQADSAVGTLVPELTEGFQSPAFTRLAGFSEVMILYHDRGADKRFASYPLLPAFQGRTFHWIMNNVNDSTLTEARARSQGSVPTVQNVDRPQPLHGDVFLDFGEPLMVNKQHGWGSQSNTNRIATTLGNTSYGHTYAGLGGRHGHSGWALDYESAPISPYCALRNGYGDEATHLTGNYREVASFPLSESCRSSHFSWIPVDAAVLVR